MKLSSLLLMLAVISHTNALEWMGIGTFTDDNITDIKNYIKDHFDFSQYSNLTMTNFVVAFSDYLNGKWDPAWNVVVAYNIYIKNQDTIVYGYAYRMHWLWFNGYRMNDGHYISFIIWKDYNCHGWITINSNPSNSYWYSSFSDSDTNNLKDAINAFTPNANYNDIWKTAKDFVDFLTSKYDSFKGTDKAFTVIFSQTYWVNYFGRVCAKNYLLNYSKIGSSGATPNWQGSWGEALILQIR